MLPGAEFAMRLEAMRQATELRNRIATGEVVLREVLSGDNPPSPNYKNQDPFYGGPIRPADAPGQPDTGEHNPA